MLHGAGIFTNICPKNHPNVGKYNSTMEHIWEDIPIKSHEIPRNKIAFPNASLFLADGVRHPNPRAFFSAHQPAAGSIEGPKFLKHFQDGLKKASQQCIDALW
jgi:hypothetical protein